MYALLKTDAEMLGKLSPGETPPPPTSTILKSIAAIEQVTISR